jgi:signal transduction histidine kinase
MRERVVLLDGQLTIESQPNGGTHLMAELRIVDRQEQVRNATGEHQ